MNRPTAHFAIGSHTRLTGLLGSPVAHSMSPLMHNEAFRRLGLDYVYLCFDVKEKELEAAARGLASMGAAGFNCTMPNKMRMCELADQLSTAAELCGSVNTVVVEDGKLIGYNTDGIGYMQAVREAGHDIRQKSMTLLGAGGAATAIAVQAALDGVLELYIFNRKGRSWNRAAALTDRINSHTSCHASLYDFADTTELKKALDRSAILTNATSIGMAPQEEDCPIQDEQLLHEGLIVSDIIYNPRKTRLMELAKSRRCPTFNGLYMLLFQGAEAFRLWTEREMPVPAIRDMYFAD